MVDKEVFEHVSARIDTYENDMIALQRELTARPAIAPESGGNGEGEKARFLMEYCKSKGFVSLERIDAPDSNASEGTRPNIIATLSGATDNQSVWILTHMDVVPPGERGLWNQDPYKLTVEGRKLIGRGTEDNQQDLISSIFAAQALYDEGITPERTIHLGFVADEETGSEKGLSFLLETRDNLFRSDDIIVVPDFGDEQGGMIEVAEKSILWMRVVTKGRQCHASTPDEGTNAFTAASHLVVALDGLATVYGDDNPLFHPSRSTFEATKKEANVPNINTIPGEDVFYFDCRVLPHYDLDRIITTIRDISSGIEERFGVTIETEVIQAVPAPLPTADDAPVVHALAEAVRDVYGIDAAPVGIGGGTVAAHLRKKGYPVAVWSRLAKTAHQPNEYCLIDNMVGNAKVYAHLFLQR